jgi:hypothetical protein
MVSGPISIRRRASDTHGIMSSHLVGIIGHVVSSNSSPDVEQLRYAELISVSAATKGSLRGIVSGIAICSFSGDTSGVGCTIAILAFYR